MLCGENYYLISRLFPMWKKTSLANQNSDHIEDYKNDLNNTFAIAECMPATQ